MAMSDEVEQCEAKMSAAGRGVRWNNILVFSSPEQRTTTG